MARKKIEPSGRWLNEAELHEMTESTRVTEQAVYCRERGIPFILSPSGKPLVLVSHFESSKNTEHVRPTWKPRVLEAA